jgi:hypothetical protein
MNPELLEPRGAVLDCSSVEQAFQSLCELMGLSPAQLSARVRAIEVDWDHKDVSPERQVLMQMGLDPGSLPAPSAVRWFHATRALPGTTFGDGLQPTLQTLPRLWEALGNCADRWLSPSEWDDYQRSFSRADRFFSQQFHRKQLLPDWQGPFAFLLRDAALGKHVGHKNFTLLSEAAEDICADFEAVFRHPLQQVWQETARPCLVVCTLPGAWPGTVRAAANYVYRSLRGIECGLDCNANFDGHGQAVPFSLIDRVEWL